MADKPAHQQCMNVSCEATFDIAESLTACPKCGCLLDIIYDWDKVPLPKKLSDFNKRWKTRDNVLDFSGVWRFRELLDFCDDRFKVSQGEGQTLLQCCDGVADYVGVNQGGLFLQYEGLNPSGSFKDNGMTAAFSHASMVGAKRVACASTGNTSASLARYASAADMEAIVFVGSGRIAFGKLAQALDYGARTFQIDGDFDDCMARVKEATDALNLYLVNSVNPFRLEGQKAIMLRVLEGLGWETPDWVVVPGGNLGNSSAFGKMFGELRDLGLIKRVPRLAVINSSGAPTLDRLVNEKKLAFDGGKLDRSVICDDFQWQDDTNTKPHTIASAIEIAKPVNADKCLRALEICDGVVRQVPDFEIMNAKAQVGRHGLGCEPASAASVAGARLLIEQGVIDRDARVVCILTGHPLKDPNATVGYHTGNYDEDHAVQGERRYSNLPIPVANDLDEIVKAIETN
ncbi:MAG: threonine synthase [Planctomycetota bacterium]|jgi:threonine synthase